MLVTCILGCLGFEIGEDLRLNEHKTSYLVGLTFVNSVKEIPTKIAEFSLDYFCLEKVELVKKTNYFIAKFNFGSLETPSCSSFFPFGGTLKDWMRFVIWI